MRGLRVLQVTPYYAEAWAYGGVPRAATALARGLARRGHAVTVCTSDAAEPAARARGLPGADGVSVHMFPNVSNALAYRLQLFLPRGMDRWLAAHARDFDVAHLHACHNVPTATAAHRLRAASVPYVLSPHGTAPRIERRRALKWLFDHTVGRGVLEGAARLLAVSEAERRQLLALGVKDAAIDVVPNPVELADFIAIPRGPFRAARGLAGRRVVLFLGKLTPRKRLDVVVDAFVALGDASATLVIAGNDLGAGPDARRRAERAGIAARVVFTGLLRGAERLQALADADVVVYPSRDEVFGLVAVEALLAGTPVIVADDSGCAEVIAATGGGRVVGQGDVAALAAAVRDVLAAPGRYQVAEADRRIRAWLASDAIAARVETVYESLVAPGLPLSAASAAG
jgi:glycosyltransferase involved in cell wall biosynthesis